MMNAPAETNDIDTAWSAATSDAQARNAKAYEVELLVARSRAKSVGRNSRPRPVALDEQEWLLKGRFVTRVVVGRDGSPARMVVPDPRWFALQKLWMSEQEKRNPLKRGKERQDIALLDAIHAAMPQFKMDADFEAEIPDELKRHYDRWKKMV